MSKRCCDNFNNNTFVCTIHSKIKMIVFWNTQVASEKQVNSLTLLSFMYLNPKPDMYIVQKMKDRLLKNFKNQYNCIEFYNRNTNVLLEKIMP